MDILEGLNAEQRLAATHTEGPLLVVAGAGTGKTQVITRRIAYLIQQQLARPGQILALTFTEKAAREMEERLYGLIGWESFQVPVMTFHAFGTELLSRYSSHIGRSIRGGLLNDTQKSLLLMQHYHRLKLKYYGPQSDLVEFLDGIVGYINQLQNSNISAEQYESYVQSLELNPGAMHPRDVDEQHDLASFYSLYERLKSETGTFDYNDQLKLPLRILQERPNLSQRLKNEYKFVLVDEYQDTNSTQDSLLKTFIGTEGNIFAVGDDDQAIYGFRGADIANILNFAQHYKLKKPVALIRNYRSGQQILDSAYRLIQNNNPQRLEAKLGISKRLIAEPKASELLFQPYQTPADEQIGVIFQIRRRLERGEPANGMAVLASTHAPLKAMAKLMRAHQIPFALSTIARIFEQPELINLWYLMKWLNFEADESAIAHVIMGPFIRWTSHKYRKLIDLSREGMISFEEAMRISDDSDSIDLTKKLDQWRIWAKTLPVSQLAFRLVFENGVSDDWRNQAVSNPRLVRVFEDLQRWFNQMQDYETVAFDTTLTGYLKIFPKPPDLEVSEPIGDSDGVQLLTVHASKGLEFDSVFLIACTQRNWSSRASNGKKLPTGLVSGPELPPEHEMRRLMYVALTRAKHRLQISAATETISGVKQSLSPFVGEIFGTDVGSSKPLNVTGNKMDVIAAKLRKFYPLADMLPPERYVFEDASGEIDLSVTALAAYEYCPFEFYLEHVLQIKQPIGPQLAFGTTIHRVFESYYRAILSHQGPERESLHAFLDEIWSNRGYETQAEAENDRQLAHATLDKFIHREVLAAREIEGTEVKIKLELPEAKLVLRGKIDALFRIDQGIEVRDFKTGRTKTDSDKLSEAAKNSFQLRTYALAYEVLKGEAPARVVLDYVVTGVEGAASLSPTILRNHRAKLAQLVGRIRNRDFVPNPSPMHRCAAIRYYGTGEQESMLENFLVEQEVDE